MKTLITQGIILFLLIALAIANVIQEEVFFVSAFVHQKELLVNIMKMQFSFHEKFPTVIALAQLGGV